MKKSKKLLSVILAVIMVLTSLSVLASAYTDSWSKLGDGIYNSNDKAMSTNLTDEERAAWLCDTLDDLLAGLNIKTELLGKQIDMTSINALGTTVDSILGLLNFGAAFVDLGLIENLNFDAIKGINRSQTDVVVLEKLFKFIDANAGELGKSLANGLSLGIIESSAGLDLSAIKDIPLLVKKSLYDLGVRRFNAIGADSAYPDEPKWADLDAAQQGAQTLDGIVQDLIVGLITEPSGKTYATKASDNEIITNPTKFGATAAMIHQEADTGRYYIYGNNMGGIWDFTVNSTKDEEDKNYIMHWDASSALMPDFDTSLIDFTNTSLYTLIGQIGPIIYDEYGADGLNGQLRATIMQWCGAFNGPIDDAAEKAAVKTEFERYLAMTDAEFSAALAQTGIYGTRNFLYIPLNGNTYYCVEWKGSYELYKVDTTNKTAFYDYINWEYQIGDWNTLWTAATGSAYDATSADLLGAVNNIIAYILGEAVPQYTGWAKDSGSQKNVNIESNISDLIKYVVSINPEQIFGKGTDLPDNLGSYGLEQIGVMIAKIVINNLMPSLILPETVSSLEEVIVYAVREFIAEILPEISWDSEITAAAAKTGAAKEDAFLDIALRMGTSIAVYYVRETIGYTGTISAATSWNDNFNGIIDFVISEWLPGLTTVMRTYNSEVFNGTDALDKLSVIFNSLFPTALTLIDGCSSDLTYTTVTNVNKNFTPVTKTCPVDLKVVYNLLRGLLNGNIEPIANKLYRNTTGAGTLAVYPAIINVLKDLTAGLGFSVSNDYSGLTGVLDTALASPTPLDTLVSKAQLQALVSNLLWTISDSDNTITGADAAYNTVTKLWPQDLLRIVIQLTGALDEMSYQGTTIMTDKTNYFGANTATVTPSVTMNTKGVVSAFAQGGYGAGPLTVDGKYSAKLVELKVVNFNTGVQLATTGSLNIDLTPNQAYSGTQISFAPDASYSIYTVEAYVTIVATDGTALNGGEPFKISTNIAASTSLPTTDADARIVIWDDSKSHFLGWNFYVDENTPLDAVADPSNKTATFWTSDGIQRSMWIEGYGYNNANADGSYTVTEHNTNAGSWTVYAGENEGTYQPNDVVGAEIATNGKPVPFYWNWNSGDTNDKSGDDDPFTQQWLVDATAKRSDYPADITVFEFSVNNTLAHKYYQFPSNTTKYQSFKNNPTIVMYNSYGLAGAVNAELTKARSGENYTAESWAAYTSALQNALTLVNQNKAAGSFLWDNWDIDNGCSYYKTYSLALKAAVAGLVNATEGSASGSGYTQAEKAALAALKTQLDAQGAKEYNNKDFIAYRWWLYYNKYSELSNFYSATQAPEAPLPSLAGVDDKDVDAAIAALPTNLQALAAALKTAATQEELDAYNTNLEYYNANLPKVDISDLQIQENKMATYDSRLIADTANNQYLVSAIEQVTGLVGAESAYTTQSYAKYQAALTAANAVVTAAAAAKPSEIHETRYNLLVAYNRLVGANEAADFTQLNALIAQAEAILANQDIYDATDAYKAANSTLTPAEAKTQALASVLATLGAKVTVGEKTYTVGGGDTAINYQADEGMYFAVNQSTIDWIASKLAEAMSNVACTYVAQPSGSDVNITVDNGEYMITGVTPGSIASANDIADRVVSNNPADTTLTFTANDNQGYGTGAKGVLTLKSDGSTIATYVVVVYGDVNGDGVIDAFDTSVMDLAVEGGVNLSGAYRTAGGLASGTVSAENYATVRDAVVGNAVIAQ